jgi:broad specificity phosphatase PhoE
MQVDGWRAHKKETEAAKSYERKVAKQAVGEILPPPEPKSYDDDEGDSYDVVVCHGNVIRYFVCRALQLPPEGWLKLATFNCGLTHLAIR